MSKRSVIRVGVLVVALGLVYGGFDIAGAAPGPPTGPPGPPTQTVVVDNVPYSHVVGTLQFGAPCQTQIAGETCDPTAGPSVNVYGWSTGAASTATVGSASGGAGAGKATFKQLEFRTKMDSSTESFFDVLFAGKHYDTATLTVTPAKGNPITFTFGVIFVDSVTFSDDGSSSTPNPMMDVTLEYGALHITTASA